MRSIRVVLSILAGFLASLLLAELSLRTLPVSMGLYRTQKHDAWPLHAYGPNQNFSYSMTWQMLHPNRGMTNNYGQISPFDYSSGKKPLMVVGDSFIEAQMNSYQDTLQGNLDRLLNGQLPVYSFGFSGNSLAEYLAVSRMAKDEFEPRGIVFLIIDNDVKESWTNRSGHHYFKISGNSVTEAYLPFDTGTTSQKLRAKIGDSSLFRYIQVNLAFTLEGAIERRKAPQRTAQVQSSESEENSRLAYKYFLDTLPEASGLPTNRLTLVFDSDRETIYTPSQPPRKRVDSPETQSEFKTLARRLVYNVIDTEPLFKENFAKKRQRFDYTPIDRHWNGLAHRLVSNEAYRIIIKKISLE